MPERFEGLGPNQVYAGLPAGEQVRIGIERVQRIRHHRGGLNEGISILLRNGHGGQPYGDLFGWN